MQSTERLGAHAFACGGVAGESVQIIYAFQWTEWIVTRDCSRWIQF